MPRRRLPVLEPNANRAFNIDHAIGAIREAVAPVPKAALCELPADGFKTPVDTLVACIISIRTLDEVTVPTARRLFAAARTPQEVAVLSVTEIDRLIGTCTFHEPKAGQIREIARRVIAEHGGEL